MTATASPCTGLRPRPTLAALLGVRVQRRAAARPITAPLEPYVVVAGAGSGKTTVMTARVVWLVATGAVRPDQVLGLTFTTKAAGELAARVRRRADAARRRAGCPTPTVGEPTVSTYHAFAGRLIAEHGLRLGVEPGARLLTGGATRSSSRTASSRAPRATSRRYGSALQQVVEHVLALDAELAEHCVEPADLRAFDAGAAAPSSPTSRSPRPRSARSSRRRPGGPSCAHLVDEVRAAKSARDLLDFADQMRLGARLAQRHPRSVPRCASSSPSCCSTSTRTPRCRSGCC